MPVGRLTLGYLVQVGRYGGLEEEVEHLKRDKNVLMLELVRLRQQQQVQTIPAMLPVNCLKCCSLETPWHNLLYVGLHTSCQHSLHAQLHVQHSLDLTSTEFPS